MTPDLFALGLALLVALAAAAVLRGDRPLAIAFATVGRLFTTGWVFARYITLGVVRKLRASRAGTWKPSSGMIPRMSGSIQ